MTLMTNRSGLTASQKRKYVLAGLVISLVCSGIIGGALAIAAHNGWAGVGAGGVCFIYCNSIYFSGTP